VTLILQSEGRPGTVLNAISDVVSPDSEALTLAVAYVTPDGVDSLMKRLALRLAPRSITELTTAIVTSFDFGWSVPKALRVLADDYGFEVRIANLVPGTANPRTNRGFHSKMYLGCRPNLCALFVGSANLTARALTVNSEAGYLDLDIPSESADWIRNEILSWGVPLTPGLLSDYTKWRQDRPSPEPPPPKPNIPPPNALNTLQEAISANQTNPVTLDFLWVEAGSMSSGGSHNQLELPRGANWFFDFNYTAYRNVAQEPLGTVRVAIPGRADVDCPFTWHGHNGMERLNLPTQAKGGYDYAHTVVLFERQAGQFVLYAEPEDSYAVDAWRAASLKTGRLYRLGQNSPRRCGFF
jgi:HKD family nuclease